MYKTVYSIIGICIVILLGSCEKDANVKLPAVESKLVINSFISPQDTLIRVVVSLSQPLYNNANSGNYFSVANATVQISDGINTQLLAYNQTESYYYVKSSQLPIIVGKTYYLTVTTPDGKNVNASTTIPTSNSSLSFSSHVINNPNQTDTYLMETHWNDQAGIEDYYRIVYYQKQFTTYTYDTSSITYVDTTYYYDLNFSDNISDKNNNGSTMNQNFQFTQDPNSSGNLGEIYLLHATKEYYLFHKILKNANDTQDDPFAEPVQMYTNINGGYGVFAGFNQYKLPVSL
jgi:hypothetical protein